MLHCHNTRQVTSINLGEQQDGGVHGLQAALSTLVGTAGSYAYLRWLIHDMDGLSEDMVVPFRYARAQPAGVVQTLALGFAAYRSAIASKIPQGCPCWSMLQHIPQDLGTRPSRTQIDMKMWHVVQASLETQASGCGNTGSSSGSFQCLV